MYEYIPKGKKKVGQPKRRWKKLEDQVDPYRHLRNAYFHPDDHPRYVFFMWSLGLKKTHIRQWAMRDYEYRIVVLADASLIRASQRHSHANTFVTE
jgi:hypothetical protein